MKRPRRVYDIERPEQMAALASSVRQEIVDTVHSLGPCSIREVAHELGRPADGLYHHVRQLLRVGLLIDAGERPAARRPEALVATPTQGVLRLRYDPSDPDNAEAIGKIVTSMTRVAERDFRNGFAPELARCSGPRRNLLAGRQKAWLTGEQVREVNQLLARLQEIFTESHSVAEGDLHSLTFVLAPIAPSERIR